MQGAQPEKSGFPAAQPHRALRPRWLFQNCFSNAPAIVWSEPFPQLCFCRETNRFLLLASNLGYRYRTVPPGSGKGRRYGWLPGTCTRAVSVCLPVSGRRQVQTRTHASPERWCMFRGSDSVPLCLMLMGEKARLLL